MDYQKKTDEWYKKRTNGILHYLTFQADKMGAISVNTADISTTILADKEPMQHTEYDYNPEIALVNKAEFSIYRINSKQYFYVNFNMGESAIFEFDNYNSMKQAIEFTDFILKEIASSGYSEVKQVAL